MHSFYLETHCFLLETSPDIEVPDLLILSAAAIAQNVSQSATSPFNLRVTHVLGFEGAKSNAGGTLSIQDSALQVQKSGKATVQVQIASLPKCLIEVDDKTILDHQIEGLLGTGIEEIAIVVGYEKQQFIRHMQKRFGHLAPQIEFIENSAFAITNNVYSVWMAREWINGDGFACLNADVICDPQILASALNTEALVSMIVDREWRDETMKVVIADDRVLQMSKKISKQEFSGTYIGITVFDKRVNTRFFDKMQHLIAVGRVNEFSMLPSRSLFLKVYAWDSLPQKGWPGRKSTIRSI